MVNKKIGKDEEKLRKSEEKFIQTGGKVKLTFRQNRKFDLHLKRKVYTFHGKETKEIDRSLLDHKDFTDNIKQYFVIHG